jgi:hypothetical protein
MLMLFARITYFDNQEFPLSKGITFRGSDFVSLPFGLCARREANELKYCQKECADYARKGCGEQARK